MRITLAQYSPVWEDRIATRRKIDHLLIEMARTDWIVFPEMALSGFSMDIAKTTWNREDFEFFSEIAKERSCWITAGGVEDGRNVAFAVCPSGEIVARYAKRHLFSFAGEDQHYIRGNDKVFYRIGEVMVSQAICYDLRFPYHFWEGARDIDLHCVIAAWGGKRAEHWKTLLRARAIENQAFVVGVNRVGQEPTSEYAGDSVILGPAGETILDCGSAEGFFSAEIDVSTIREWRQAFPAIGDRLS